MDRIELQTSYREVVDAIETLQDTDLRKLFLKYARTWWPASNVQYAEQIEFFSYLLNLDSLPIRNKNKPGWHLREDTDLALFQEFFPIGTNAHTFIFVCVQLFQLSSKGSKLTLSQMTEIAEQIMEIIQVSFMPPSTRAQRFPLHEEVRIRYERIISEATLMMLQNSWTEPMEVLPSDAQPYPSDES